MPRREGGRNRLPVEPEVTKRVEADVVRMQSERLPSGLYRHTPAKLIFEISKQEQDGRWRG